MVVRNNDTKVCVMRGFYDEGGEYREKYYDDVALFELPEKAQIRIDFNYDVTVLYSPNEVLVIAKKSQDIEEHKKLEGTPRFSTVFYIWPNTDMVATTDICVSLLILKR